MASNRSYSIYGRIVIIVSIPILLLTCLLLGVYRVFYNMSMAQAKENFVLQTEQCTASFDQQFDAIASLAQSVGQLWLVNYSKQRLTCRPLLDLLEGRGLGVISWDGAPSERYQVLALSSLKKGGGRP